MFKFLSLAFALAIIAGCSKSDHHPQQDTASATSVASLAPPPISPRYKDEDERAAIIARELNGFRHSRDKIESISFYSDQHLGEIGPEIRTYIGIRDQKQPVLRMVVGYMGDTWIFFDRVKVMADDKIVYDRHFQRSEIRRNNEGNFVLEISDRVATLDDRATLERIAAAKDVTIRLAGSDRQADRTLNKAELAAIRHVLSAESSLQESLYGQAP